MYASENMQAEPPSTPARGRAVSRYPAALSKGEPGRVPLLRRGTSRTLECMEDLLREYGYKETRVFTPEAERIEAMAEERKEQQSTWRIKELLAGWLPGTAGSQPAGEDEDTPGPNRARRSTSPTYAPTAHRSTPSSPLSHKRRLDHNQDLHPLSSPNSASSTTCSSTRSANTLENRTVSYQPTRHLIHDRVPAIRAETSSASLRTYAQVSAARGYLRHMVSTPNMAKRSYPSTRDYSRERVSPENPLPTSWLESVTKAVLSSGASGAYVGGPTSPPSNCQFGRPTRASKENKSLFSDQTPTRTSGRSASGLPPGATLYLQRPQTAPSTLNTAHVVCRSAPGSRSSSRVGHRGVAGGGGSFRVATRKDRPDRGRRGSRIANIDRVPSLAATRLENDAWGDNFHWVDGKRVPLLHLDDASHEDAVDSDDEDDGELDLARLLVPPKRQYSIQSLRKHLHVARSQAHAIMLNAERWEDEDVPTRGRSRPVHIDESDGYPTFERTDSKRRRGLPGAWGNLGGGRS